MEVLLEHVYLLSHNQSNMDFHNLLEMMVSRSPWLRTHVSFLVKVLISLEVVINSVQSLGSTIFKVPMWVVETYIMLEKILILM